MIFEYEKPSVEIISFVALERLASEQDARDARDGGDSVGILGSLPTVGEGVEDWG